MPRSVSGEYPPTRYSRTRFGTRALRDSDGISHGVAVRADDHLVVRFEAVSLRRVTALDAVVLVARRIMFDVDHATRGMSLSVLSAEKQCPCPQDRLLDLEPTGSDSEPHDHSRSAIRMSSRREAATTVEWPQSTWRPVDPWLAVWPRTRFFGRGGMRACLKSFHGKGASSRNGVVRCTVPLAGF